MSGGGAEEGTEQPLREWDEGHGGVSTRCLCEHTRSERLDGETLIVEQRNGVTLGWSHLVPALAGGPGGTAEVCVCVGGGLQPPSLLIQLPRQLRGSTCKNKTDFKKEKKKIEAKTNKSQTAQNGLNLMYSVVYTCN